MLFDTWTDIVGKLGAGALVLLVYMHLLGKLAPMAAIDQISNIVLGGIMGGIIYNPAIRIYEFVFVIVCWSGLMLLIKVVKQHSVAAQNVIDGKPTLLVKDGKPLTDNIASAHLNARDFTTLLHQHNIVDVGGLESVWYEQNGQVSITKKGEPSRPIPLVEDGRVLDGSLERVGRDQSWLDEELRKQNAKLENIFLAEWHDEGVVVHRYDSARPDAQSAGRA